MRDRLLPATLFAAAAALYWLVALVVLRALVPLKLASEFPADDGCGGECTVYLTPTEMLEPLVLSAVAAALVAAAAGPRLAARFDDRPESVPWAGVWITAGAYVLGYVGTLVALGVSGGLDVSAETLAGPLVFAPFLLTALPVGIGAARLWHRLLPAAPDVDGERP